MGVQVVTSGATAQASTVTTRSLTLGAVAAGDLVVAATTRSNPANTDTYGSDVLTDDLGNSYTTLSPHANDNSDVQGLTMYAGIITVPGTPTLTATFPESSNFAGLVAGVWRGVRNQAADAIAKPTGGPPDRLVMFESGVPITVDPTGGGELCVAAWTNASGNSLVVANGELTQLQVIGHLIWLAYGVIASGEPYQVKVSLSPPTSTSVIGVASMWALDTDDPAARAVSNSERLGVI